MPIDLGQIPPFRQQTIATREACCQMRHWTNIRHARGSAIGELATLFFTLH